MTIDNQEEYIQYRLKKAAVIALLLSKGIKATTHDGCRTQLGLNFIKPGIIDKEYGKLYSKLFDFRQKGDYGDLFDYDKDTVDPLIESAREFVSEVKRHIELHSESNHND
ncbi:MAG: HEPN domain-containing protein [Bacteroidota bacterium]